MLAIIGIVIVSVPLVGGDLSKLGTVNLRFKWLIFAGLALQIMITVVVRVSESTGELLHLVSYVPVLAFLVLNSKLRGVALVTLGATLNILAIVANKGTMPASLSAVQSAGIHYDESFSNSAPVAHPKLQFLGDIFAVPQRFPLANVYSIGDILIVLGAAWCIYSTTRRIKSERVPEGQQPSEDAVDTPHMTQSRT